MRVLMFGWEFPPHIAGGLGTACEGIVKGLAANGVETLFVMPSASGDEDQSATTIINASDVAVDTVSESVEQYLDKVKFIHIGTNMVPYADPEEFSRLVEEDRARQVKDFAISYGQKYKFSGKYGKNLMEEVARYAMVGGTIALQRKDEFDVIHAHDWLTYYAGIAAKELTGKPLVIHVHATSFDRGSVDNIDTRVFEIEKRGMLTADRVITVSDLTRNTVINKYGIDPSKVITVHNAVDFSGRPQAHQERAFRDCRKRRYDEPLHPSRGKARHLRPFPFHRLPPRSGCPEDVRPLGCIYNAVHFRALRHFAPRGYANGRPVHHFQAVRCGRSAALCLQGGLLGRGRDGRRHLCPAELSRPGGFLYQTGF